jgi:hypothetical protein
MEDEKADGLEQYDTKHIKDGRMLPQSHSAWGETGLGEQHRKGTQSAVIRGGAVVKQRLGARPNHVFMAFLLVCGQQLIHVIGSASRLLGRTEDRSGGYSVR